MAYRASQAFVAYVGTRRLFVKDEIVPDEVARKVLAFTYDDGTTEPAATPKPRKRAAKKSTD